MRTQNIDAVFRDRKEMCQGQRVSSQEGVAKVVARFPFLQQADQVVRNRNGPAAD